MAIGTPDPASLGPNGRRVLAYGDCIERTVEAAKDPAFTLAGWAELEALLDVARFERVGNMMERQTWTEYRDLLTRWAGATTFWARFRRITEAGNLVFLELEEHNTPKDGPESVVNSVSVYEFDDAGKLIHLDIYLQVPQTGG